MRFKESQKMYYIWFVLAVLCLGYYIRCATYAGIHSSFIFIWIIGTFFFGAIFVVRILEIKHGVVIVPWIRKTFVIIVSIGMLFFLGIEGLIIANMNSYPKEECEYIIVLGCQIRGDKITKSLKKRLETAYSYADQYPNAKIIVSGGQGEDEDLSEAQAMHDYLIEQGISQNRIFMEDQSVNTDENLRYSLRYIENKDARVGIVTSNFHIFRAVNLAEAKGLTQVCGIASPSDNILVTNYMIREAIGVVKDFAVGNFFQ